MNDKSTIKLPNGRVIRHQADPLATMLAQYTVDESAILPPGDYDHKENAGTDLAHRPVDRSSTVPDTRALDGKSVLVLGAGAVGGYVCRSLAALACLTLHLVDFDIVDAKHTRAGRTIYQPSQVNQKKVVAAKDLIERDHPDSRVIPYPFNVMDLPDIELVRLARRSAVTINAIDDATAMWRVNALLYSLVEVLYVALHRGAESAHVIVTVPYATACLRCALELDGPEQIQTLHGEPGLGLDIQNAANWCATLACELMYAKATGHPIRRWDLTKNIFFFANKSQPLSPDGPGVRMQQAHRRPGCPVCSTAGANGNVV